MKVTLDLSKLLQDGQITPEEHDRLAAFALKDTGQLLINILIGFGVFAVSAGAIALIPNVFTGIILGGILMAVGIAIISAGRTGWNILAHICILVAALTLGAGFILFSQGVVDLWGGTVAHKPILGLALAYLAVGVLFTASALLARSSLLVCLAVLMLFGALGSGGGYQGDALYELDVTQPFATAVLFCALAFVLYQASKKLAHQWQRLAIAASRMAIFLVNLALWVGSLWGDDLTWLNRPSAAIPKLAFTIGWAILLFGAAWWAARNNRRWLLNIAAVFGGIHFYTQWFETLGANPISLFCGGALVIVFALAVRRLNRPANGQP